MSRLVALAVCAALCSTSFAAKVLVLQDDPLIRSTHSRYFRDLHSQGHTVTIKSVTDSTLKLRDWDDWLYDKLIIFAPSATGSKRTPLHAYHVWMISTTTGMHPFTCTCPCLHERLKGAACSPCRYGGRYRR